MVEEAILVDQPFVGGAVRLRLDMLFFFLSLLWNTPALIPDTTHQSYGRNSRWKIPVV